MRGPAALLGPALALLAALASPAAAITYKTPRQKKIPEKVWAAIAGDWIRADFVRGVEKRRSLYAAMESGGADFDAAARKSLTFAFIRDFGLPAVVRRSDECWIGSLARRGDMVEFSVDGAGNPDDSCADFPRSLRLLDKKPRPDSIEISGAVYVRDGRDWLPRATIAGVYRDENGREFAFGADRTARWPDREFRYRMATTGFSDVGSDYFAVDTDAPPGPGDVYCFAWEDGRLALRPATFDAAGKPAGCAGAPVQRLRIITRIPP